MNPMEHLLEQHVSQMAQSLQEVELGEYYEVLSELGTGTFGLVLEAQVRATGDTLALKCLRKGKTSMKQFLEEYAIAFYLSSHPSIVRCYGACFHTPEHYVFAQELSPIGDLCTLLEDQGVIPEEMVKRCAFQVSSALDFIHGNGLVHCDIKPENILLFDMECFRVKVTDFGLARPMGTVLRTKHGTLPYMAPELFQPSQLEAASSLDVWAFGVLLFTMLTGLLPWEQAVAEDQNYCSFVEGKHMEGGAIPSRWERLTRESFTMFGKLLNPNPMERDSIFAAQNVLDVHWTVDSDLTVRLEQTGSLKDTLSTESASSNSTSSWSDGSPVSKDSSSNSASSMNYCEKKEARDICSALRTMPPPDICSTPRTMTPPDICSALRTMPPPDICSTPRIVTPPTSNLGTEDSAGQSLVVDGSLLVIGAELEVS